MPVNLSISSLMYGPIPKQVTVGIPWNSVLPASVINLCGIQVSSKRFLSSNNSFSESMPTTILVNCSFSQL